MDVFLKFAVGYLIVSGLAKSFVITVLFLLDAKEKGEKHVKVMSNWGGVFDLLFLCYLVFVAVGGGLAPVTSFGDVLGIGSEFIFYTDTLSLGYLVFSFIILGLVGRFSCFYLHKDKHYYKFFALFYIFQTSAVLLILSDNFAAYFIGWELLGISSVLLISFYSERKDPVRNSLRIFSLYKVSDILLFTGFAVAYTHSHQQLFSEFIHIDKPIFSIYMLLTSLAIMIKMGGFPVVWLPRAMEGPTPSSAVFYGGLATHVPLLLFIKLWSGADVSPWVQYVLLAILIITIAVSTMLARIQSDAKNILAYSTVKHISIISVEVLLGFFTFAYIHLTLHCFYRLFQFIRTPSLLYEFHQAEGYNGKAFREKSGWHETLMPLWLRKRIYRLVLREFYIIPRIYRSIDILLGMTSRVSVKKVVSIGLFNFALLLLLVGGEWFEFHKFHPTLFLLLPAWTFSLITLLVNYHDWRYLAVVSLSITSLASVVFYIDGFISLNAAMALHFFLFALLALALANNKNKTKSFEVPERQKLMLFVAGLWLVGVPGPGTYYLFEKSIHLSMGRDMYLAVGAFVILSINTLGVVKNYSMDEVHFRRGDL